MKRFKRHRTLDEIQALCDVHGIELQRRLFDKGSDFVSLHAPAFMILYDPTLGRFQGEQYVRKNPRISYTQVPAFENEDCDIVYFNSNRDQPDDWYQALLNFFYTDEDPA